MPYRILILSCLCLFLNACMHASKPETMDARCTRAINSAQRLYTAKSAKVSPADASLAARLISAARIDRQQHEFIHCLDRSSRAISLLEDTPASH